MTSAHGFAGLELPELTLRAGGDRLTSASAIPDIDPCSAEIFGDIPNATADAIDQIVDAAWLAFRAPAVGAAGLALAAVS